MRTPSSHVRRVVDETNKFTWTAEVLWGKKGWDGHSLSERAPQPLPGQADTAFLGALPPARSSFVMVRQ